MVDIAYVTCANCGADYATVQPECPRCGQVYTARQGKQYSYATGAMSSNEAIFLTRFKQLAPDLPVPQREYQFDNTRRWRFDFAWPDHMVFVEIDGGQNMYVGSHNRGKGKANDIEKQNAAVLAGWKPLRFTDVQLKDNPLYCIDCVRQLLESE